MMRVPWKQPENMHPFCLSRLQQVLVLGWSLKCGVCTDAALKLIVRSQWRGKAILFLQNPLLKGAGLVISHIKLTLCHILFCGETNK